MVKLLDLKDTMFCCVCVAILRKECPEMIAGDSLAALGDLLEE